MYLGFHIDDTLMSWILTVLLMIFMFCCGVAIVSFPWILMGRPLTSHSQMMSSSLNH